MKKIYFVILAAVFFPAGPDMSGQSLKDLFNKEAIKDVVGSVVEGLDVIPENIAGDWTYSGVAVRLTGDDILGNAASALATSQIEETLDGYLEKIGLKQDTFGYTFNADSTFATTSGKLKFSGTYTFSPEDDTIVLDYGKEGRLGGVSLKAGATVSLNTMELLFNADKLLDFIEKVSSVAGGSGIGSLTALLNQYDGIKIGFSLSRKSAE